MTDAHRRRPQVRMPSPYSPDLPPRRILVIAARRLGDVLLTTPLVRSLRAAWPEARVDATVLAGNEPAYAANPDIDRVLTFPDRGHLFAKVAFFVRALRRYDLAVSTLPGDRASWLAFLSARYRIGPLDPRHPWRRILLSAWTDLDLRDTHTVIGHLRLADLLGIERRYELVMRWTDRDRDALRAALPFEPATPYAVLHPMPMFRYKAWTEAGWIELGRWLAARGLRVALTGAPIAEEAAAVGRIAAAVPGSVDLAGRLPLGAVANLLDGARVYVGPDTVVTHMAAAVGVPTVALFGPSNPLQFAPWPKGYAQDANPFPRQGSATIGNVTFLQGEGACVPCMEEGCERHRQSRADCLDGMPAARVIEAASRALAGSPAR
jgi:heptosyltransferase III